MSLLLQQILPQTIPIGRAAPDGTVQIDHNWWLLLYNLCAQVLGTAQAGLPADALQDLESADLDAIDADAIALRAPVSALALLMPTESDPSPRGLSNALLLAQDGLLPDPMPQAQPAATVTVGASPYTYTAPFAGQLSVTGGTVSLIQIIRQGTTVATGLTAGLILLARGDQAKITYSAAPTAVFLPN